VIQVRRATLTDVSHIAAFGRKAVEGTCYRELPYNAGRTRKFLQGAISPRAPDLEVFVALRGNDVCGVLIASVDVVLFSHVLMATDLAFAAEAGGDKLLDRFIAWAKEKGAVWIEMVSSQAEGYDRYAKLLQCKGFEPSGGVFRLKLKEVPK
jgi:hypothetical protein